MTLLALLLASGGASQPAEPPRDVAAERFAAMDADGNGALSADEWDRAVAARLAGRADATPALLAATRQMFARMDSDSDGGLSLAEVRAFGTALGAGPGA